MIIILMVIISSWYVALTLCVDPVLRHGSDAVLDQPLVFALILLKIVYLHVYLVSSGDPISRVSIYWLYFQLVIVDCCFSAAPTSRTLA